MNIIFGTIRSLSNTQHKRRFKICLYLRLQVTNWSCYSLHHFVSDSFQSLATIDIYSANFFCKLVC